MQFPLRLYIQMEVCESDTLLTWLQNSKRKIMEEVNMLLWTQIVEGLAFLHSNNWVHRDIKPGNIFVQYCSNNLDMKYKESPDKPFSAETFPYVVKIGDFGLAKELSSHYESVDHRNHKGKHHGHVIGTSTYASPEQIDNSNIGFASDVFSLGIILFEMFHHFDTAMERSRSLAAARKFEFSESFINSYPEVHRLVVSMLQINSSARPTAKQLLADPYIRNFVKKSDKCAPECMVDKDQMIASLTAKNELLQKTIKTLEARIVELEAQLAQR